MNDPLLYKIAISMLPGIGGILARNLIAYIGSIEGVFKEKFKALCKVPGIGEKNARKISNPEILKRAEEEIRFIEQHDIRVFFYTDQGYPVRLLQCADAPVLIYVQGNNDLDSEKVLSIVGTRNATDYGKEICENLVQGLSERNHRVLIVSGLAYGIDIQAHKSAIQANLPTVAVLGHGLDLLYPALHTEIARKMRENGGLVSDFPSKTKIEPPNFIRRNRIIAGLSDATLVVESGEKGGALVTADIAFSYNRDVFAVPGRVNDAWSKGCNRLIRNNGASLIESVGDLEYFLGWETNDEKPEAFQKQLFPDLDPDEKALCDVLTRNDPVFIDRVCAETKLPVGKVSSLLLNLEFKGVVIALPGKMYKLR
jgi:DNA processing protein